MVLNGVGLCREDGGTRRCQNVCLLNIPPWNEVAQLLSSIQEEASNCLVNLGSGRGASFLKVELGTSEVFLEARAVDSLGENICRVVSACNLTEAKVSGGQPVLNPHVRHRKVSNFSKASSFAYSDGCRAVGQNL